MSRPPEIEESFARGEFQRGDSHIGTLDDIKSVHVLRGKGDHSVGIISLEINGGITPAWLPLETDHGLKPGDTVRVTKYTRQHESGGSLTISKVELASS